MTDRKWSSDPKSESPLHAGETVGSHLAHWPPPTVNSELKPMPIRQKANAHIRHGTRRGWRLTRAMFSEFEGDDD
jgi:hypothetical protein